MCYSARIKASLKELSWEFRAQTDLDAFSDLLNWRLAAPELRVPFALDRYFVLSQDASEARLAPLVRRYHEEELGRVRAEIAATEAELRELAAGKGTAAARKKSEVRERRLTKLTRKLELSFDRDDELASRIFPGYFAPAIVAAGTERRLLPMRYRVRRPDGDEVPAQYNVFNARIDSLQSAATWKPLFGHKHALFPFTNFYEWVERDGKKQEIVFQPERRALMWAASLYSVPKAKDALPYASFAMVTDEPPPEVAAAGHDRCPIFLAEGSVDDWLHPEKFSPAALLELLQRKEKTFYLHQLAA